VFSLKGTMSEEIDENLIMAGIIWAFITLILLAYSFAIPQLIWGFIASEFSIFPIVIITVKSKQH